MENTFIEKTDIRKKGTIIFFLNALFNGDLNNWQVKLSAMFLIENGDLENKCGTREIYCDSNHDLGPSRFGELLLGWCRKPEHRFPKPTFKINRLTLQNVWINFEKQTNKLFV